jgi:hypothetical protein
VSRERPARTTIDLARHSSPEQARAVFERLQAVRAAVWALHGPQAQQAWLDQPRPAQEMPEVDPDDLC